MQLVYKYKLIANLRFVLFLGSGPYWNRTNINRLTARRSAIELMDLDIHRNRTIVFSL